MTDSKRFSRPSTLLRLLPPLAILLALSVGATAFSQSSKPTDPTLTVPSETQADVEAYWTSSQMASAVPAEVDNVPEAPADPSVGPDGPPAFIDPTQGSGPDPICTTPTPTPTPTTGATPAATPTVTFPVRGPAGRHPGISPKATSVDELQPNFQPAGVAPWVYSRYSVFPAGVERAYPYSTVGKIFFTRADGKNFVCSGSSITAGNHSVVWTAGHCLFTRGFGWNRNVLFVPARRNGANPFGVWTARQLVSTVGWVVNGLLEYDWGAFTVNRGGIGGAQCLSTTVGGLGMAVNLPRVQHWHDFGYPAQPPFNGEIPQVCTATFAGAERPTGGLADPPTNGIGCDQNGGASGGPWVVDFFERAAPGTNRVNSNNSYIHPGL
ncbi:MAG TPA: hypothetical protein VFC23_06475, partial [Thermoanaerobaculia bacterium]|nr:hypothetical protein [Thermoanaerobaculia bacterium]